MKRLPVPLVAGALGGLLVLAVFSGVALGETKLGGGHLFRALLAGPTNGDPILWAIRLPRVALAALVGAALASAGTSLQGLTGNALADPFLLGAASGAAVGAGGAILFGLSGTLWLPALAFVGALLATGLTLLLARSGGRGSAALLLAGVVCGTFLSALTNLLLALARQDQSRVLGWLLGWLGDAEWWQVAALAAVVLPCVFVLSRLGPGLDALSFGEETARAVGIDVERLGRLTLVLCALLTATAVAFSGVIGFIGLVTPHAIRALVGPPHRAAIPLSALLGASLLTLADLLSRAAVPGQSLPLGVVTALLGAPIFAFLLRRQAGE